MSHPNAHLKRIIVFLYVLKNFGCHFLIASLVTPYNNTLKFLIESVAKPIP